MPSIRGILISRTAISGIRLLNASRAACPSLYVSTSKPSASSVIETDVRIFLSSSTNAILDIKCSLGGSYIRATIRNRFHLFIQTNQQLTQLAPQNCHNCVNFAKPAQLDWSICLLKQSGCANIGMVALTFLGRGISPRKLDVKESYRRLFRPTHKGANPWTTVRSTHR